LASLGSLLQQQKEVGEYLSKWEPRFKLVTMILPSLALYQAWFSSMIYIPDEFSGSWYQGQVNVLLKESAFEPSSPMRHTTELSCILKNQVENHASLVYTDHRVTYLSVQVALISVFLNFDLDSSVLLALLHATLGRILLSVLCLPLTLVCNV